jgi:hypothetical protein
VAQPLDAVALHQAHRTGIEIGPHRLAAVSRLGRIEFLGDEVEGRLPTGFLPAPLALAAGAHQRLQKPIGMMDAFGVSRDLGADDAGRVVVVPGAVDAADPVRSKDLDVERAGRRAVVRAGGMAYSDLGLSVGKAGMGVHGAAN